MIDDERPDAAPDMRVAVVLAAAAISLASAAVLPGDIDDVVDPPVGDEAAETAEAAGKLVFLINYTQYGL